MRKSIFVKSTDAPTAKQKLIPSYNVQLTGGTFPVVLLLLQVDEALHVKILNVILL